MKVNFNIVVPFLILCSGFTNRAEAPVSDTCALKNVAFKNGEQITFTVFYAALGIFVNAGTATFTTELETLNNKPVYHVTGEGKTNSSYDWIFKVRDKYESYIDTATLQSYKFVRNINEGGYKKYQNVTFNRTASTATSADGVFKVPACVQDVVSALYYFRNIDFTLLRPGDRIPFAMFLDNEVFNLHVRYIGKETIKTKYGKFNTLKLKPLLIKGEVFDGGEDMSIWITDDSNRIPVRVESPLVVGKVKIDMMAHKNLRYPLDALEKRR